MNTFLYTECGCCGHYHHKGFSGDCRDNSQRFTAEQIEKMHGWTVWDRVLTLDEQEAQEKEMEDAL